jgi:hypothetical protein
MLQYAIFLVAGFLQTYITLFFWGFSAGPATSAPYFDLVAALVLGVVLTPLSVHLPKLAALIAVPIITGQLVVSAILQRDWRSFLSPTGFVVIGISIWILVRQKGAPVFRLQFRWSLWKAAAMVIAPLVFGGVFLNSAVIQLLLSGPPF